MTINFKIIYWVQIFANAKITSMKAPPYIESMTTQAQKILFFIYYLVSPRHPKMFIFEQKFILWWARKNRLTKSPTKLPGIICARKLYAWAICWPQMHTFTIYNLSHYLNNVNLVHFLTAKIWKYQWLYHSLFRCDASREWECIYVKLSNLLAHVTLLPTIDWREDLRRQES